MTAAENNNNGSDNTFLATLTGEQLVWLFAEEQYIAVKVKDLLYLESQVQPKETTKVFFIEEGQEKHVVSSYGIGSWEQKLSGFGFVRIHRAFLVNGSRMSSYSRKEGMVRLKQVQKPLPVSKEGKKLMSAIVGIRSKT